MIDNPDQVERLIAKLRKSLPLLDNVTPEVAIVIREQSPKSSVAPLYNRPSRLAGDEGGIVCKVELVLRTTTGLFSRKLLSLVVVQAQSLVRSLRTRSVG